MSGDCIEEVFVSHSYGLDLFFIKLYLTKRIIKTLSIMNRIERIPIVHLHRRLPRIAYIIHTRLRSHSLMIKLVAIIIIIVSI